MVHYTQGERHMNKRTPSVTCWIELDVEVEYDYSPYREARMPSPSCETGEPPEAEEFEITTVLLKGDAPTAYQIDIVNFLPQKQLDTLEQQIRDSWLTEPDGDY